VWSACARAFEGRTVLVIAHRFTMLDWVDRVLVLADGRLVEQGTVAELLERKGMFYALHRAQQ
jgi:subfamily B ATP-binding cassette protein MsbA